MGIRLLAIFFAFGASMCGLTIVLLLFPGTPLDPLWTVNPEAHSSFQGLGGMSVLIMSIVGVACASAAVGLTWGAIWGRWLALMILAINLVGDIANAVLLHDYRSLIGLPIGGAMIIYLLSQSVRARERRLR